jgi:hypothetical protein
VQAKRGGWQLRQEAVEKGPPGGGGWQAGNGNERVGECVTLAHCGGLTLPAAQRWRKGRGGPEEGLGQEGVGAAYVVAPPLLLRHV